MNFKPQADLNSIKTSKSIRYFLYMVMLLIRSNIDDISLRVPVVLFRVFEIYPRKELWSRSISFCSISKSGMSSTSQDFVLSDIDTLHGCIFINKSKEVVKIGEKCHIKKTKN